MHSIEFFKAVMKRHDQLSTDYEPEGAQDIVDAPATPSKKPKAKKKQRRPAVPRKKDGSVSNTPNVF
jgi:hypothetical protein